MNQLKVFVSSTCYDLSQIRADLFDFISGLGYQPVLSEYSSFPINPDNDTLSNCLDNVKTCDIFVLIVGSRYGYIIDNGKSITNSEYLYAKQLGIPVYIFINKRLITFLPIWKKNKNADFSDSIDSPKLFEFVEELRSYGKNWCFEFEKVQDIINIAKIQFSHLFRSSLEIKKKFNVHGAEYWDKLSAKALKITIDKNEYFELLYFAQVLEDELTTHENLKLDFEYEILLGCNKMIVDTQELIDWMGEQLESITQFVNTGTSLFNNAFVKYYGKSGEPSDLKGLYYVAFSVARLYREMFIWSINVSSTAVAEDFLALKNSFCKYCISTAKNIEDYPNKIRSSIINVQEKKKFGEQNLRLDISLDLKFDDEIHQNILFEMSRLTKLMRGITD